MLCRVISLLSMIVFLSGCMSVSNYYTGKVLPENDYSLSIIANKSTIDDEDIIVSPAVDFAYGLPYDFEMGFKYTPISLFETYLRYQITPKEFRVFDCSANLHYGQNLIVPGYIKYGITLSKEMEIVEPYVHYSFYRNLSKPNEENIKLTSDVNNSVGFGISIQVKKIKIMPEINWQYSTKDIKQNITHFGVAIKF